VTESADIRRATADDYLGVCGVLEQLDALHHDRVPRMFASPVTPARPFEYFSDLLTGARSVVLVAEAGDVVGVAIGLLRDTPDLPVFHRATFGVVHGIAVAPAWRRRSVGRRLVRGVEGWACAEGAAWVELNVFDFNRDAAHFYESLGYEPLMRKLHKPTSPTG
jgi:GNAT superfamily N-acetyltransferase